MYYKPAEYKQIHSISQVFSNLEVSKEIEFCSNFFTKENTENFFRLLGIELPSKIEDIVFNMSIPLGKNVKHPDVIIFFENGPIFYLEVMSQSNFGRWDQNHHEQLYLKKLKLQQIFEGVTTFAISFGEFEPCFIQEICDLDDTYGVELYFTDREYHTKLICGESKIKDSTKYKEKYKEFWFYVQSKVPHFKGLTPTEDSWWGIQRNGISIETWTSGKGLRTCIVFRGNSKKHFYFLEEDKEHIEKNYGVEFSENLQHPRITFNHHRATINDKSLWDESVEFINFSYKILTHLIKKELEIKF
jgi:hypothetical protein